jgi:hypothetical protein
MSIALRLECTAIELRIAETQLRQAQGELDILVMERDIATEALCDALNQLSMAKFLLSSWKSAPSERLESLQAEIAVMREEMARFTRGQMS